MSFEVHNWLIKENTLGDVRFAESLCSLGNGYMGLRGTFEEDYSGNTHQGQYIGGVWFPDKTRVGWWKNGYPQYFGKAINCVNLIGIHVLIEGETLDLHKLEVLDFCRELDMEKAVLRRRVRCKTAKGVVEIHAERFVSLYDKQLLAIEYKITADYDCNIILKPYLDANVKNLDSNYEETFWNMLKEKEEVGVLGLLTQTKENAFSAPRFLVAAAMATSCTHYTKKESLIRSGYVEQSYEATLKANEILSLNKYSVICTDRDMPKEKVLPTAIALAQDFARIPYSTHYERHIQKWKERWDKCDVIIKGDAAAQQGIRFNLFHLLSTYSGEDPRLNIGPKGFTGEKYGGATYWDTEAYCLPVYMATEGESVAKQLLKYRHIQLPEAYINAQAQGLKGALYPMVTFTGLECHNEWEITFEEIHRNAAIAYAIYNYTSYTGKEDYLLNEGYDVLCGIARFWVDRVHYSKRTGKYMIHGVTGPNEYENNVNNNWYTNRISAWCLSYFIETSQKVSSEKLNQHNVTEKELSHMQNIVDKMYYPYDTEKDVFIQHDTFLDKDIMPASDIPEEDRPINQHWSWDKVLRSCFIKQADVLQGLYFLNNLYSKNCIKKNFDFYEPMTVHESSLSPCVHSILASQIGYQDKAVEMYLRTARLDLDNINNDTEDGLHITSMAGSWLSMAQGFAGMRTFETLSFAPFLPKCWQGYAFKLVYRDRLIKLSVQDDAVFLELLQGKELSLKVYDTAYTLKNTLKIENISEKYANYIL